MSFPNTYLNAEFASTEQDAMNAFVGRVMRLRRDHVAISEVCSWTAGASEGVSVSHMVRVRIEEGNPEAFNLVAEALHDPASISQETAMAIQSLPVLSDEQHGLKRERRMRESGEYEPLELPVLDAAGGHNDQVEARDK